VKKSIILLAFVGSLLFAAAAMATSTQYVADALGYQPQLGPPMYTFGTWRVYLPWSWLRWDADYGRYAPQIFRVAGVLTYGGGAAGLLVFLAFTFLGRARPPSTSHGSATWAADSQLKRLGLIVPPAALTPPRVVLCQTADAVYAPVSGPTGLAWKMRRAGRLITHAGPEHVMVFAPTRSGKGVGTVIPTLLTWSASAIVYDIKKELWTLTAGYRRQFSHCLKFEPTAADSVRFNPLFEIRKGSSEVSDAQNIADILVDPNGTATNRDHWQATAHTLLVGAILHVLYAEPAKSLAGVAQFLSDPSCPFDETLHRMLVARHLPSGPHPVVAQCAREMLNKSENELSGVLSTAKTCLALYADPVIARNTSTSDFRIADLMNRNQPVTLYFVTPPSDIDRIRPLVRLMLNQFGRRLTESMTFGPAKAYRHQLLFLLDEFPSLGKLAFFELQLAFLAGYGIKCFLIAQSLNQLEAAYGQHNSLLDNCHVRMTYTANDERTARRISDLLGQSTQTRRQRSFSGSVFGRVSESEHEHARSLLTPDEVLRLPGDEAVLLVAGSAPYRAKKLMHYQDSRFRGRAALPPPTTVRELRQELFTRAPSDWERLPRIPVRSPEPSLRADVAAPAPPVEAQLPSEPSATEAGPISDWQAFFEPAPSHSESSSPEARSAGEADDVPL